MVNECLSSILVRLVRYILVCHVQQAGQEYSTWRRLAFQPHLSWQTRFPFCQLQMKCVAGYSIHAGLSW